MGEETAWGMEKRHNRVTHDLVQVGLSWEEGKVGKEKQENKGRETGKGARGSKEKWYLCDMA